MVASVIGSIVAALPAVKYGGLYYRALERDKNLALATNAGNFNKAMVLSPSAVAELTWWQNNVLVSSRFIHPPKICMTIYSDASLLGWGATDSVRTVGGQWTDENSPEHINVLELQAAKLALLSLAGASSDCHIHLKIDNTTAVAYINKTHSVACNNTTQNIWLWAKEHNIWLSAAFIPGKSNVVADFHSRCFKENTECQLNTEIFAKLCAIFPFPNVDLFASSINKQLPTFVSWYPESEAWAVLCIYHALGRTKVLCISTF